MRAGLISAAAAVPLATLATVAALGAAGAAAAETGDGPGFTAAPATAAPGDTVTLRATGCAGPATAAAPGLFGPVALSPGEGPVQSVTVTVGRYAASGVRHEITFGCDDGWGTVPLAVGNRATAGPGALRTRLGGTLTGPGSATVLAAGVLVGTTGLVVVRRRRVAAC
jgi:hypothetical protein